MINSAIDSIIRNDEIFFTNTQSKQGRKIYFNLTWDPNYTQEQKKKKKKTLQNWSLEMQLREFLKSM